MKFTKYKKKKFELFWNIIIRFFLHFCIFQLPPPRPLPVSFTYSPHFFFLFVAMCYLFWWTSSFKKVESSTSGGFEKNYKAIITQWFCVSLLYVPCSTMSVQVVTPHCSKVTEGWSNTYPPSCDYLVALFNSSTQSFLPFSSLAFSWFGLQSLLPFNYSWFMG